MAINDHDELHFECQRCSRCCRRGGHLFLSATDLRGLAQALDLSDEEFFLEYCEVVDLTLARRISLGSDEDGACLLLQAGSCSVYAHRPLQCRAFPFWPAHLGDEASWSRVAAECPGIGQGRCWTRQEIRELVDQQEAAPLLDLSED